MNDQTESRVMARLFYLWKVPIRQTTTIAQDWLDLHPTHDYQALLSGINSYQIIVRDGALFDLTEVTPQQMDDFVQAMRGPGGIEIRDRRFQLKMYPSCFIGQEAVQWMVKFLNVSIYEALGLGRECVRRQIFHHVLREHSFENEYLFYRFAIDERD